MAKKAKKAKKSAKKTVKVKDRAVEAILVECAIAVGQGVAATATVGDPARRYWHTTFRRTIKRALSQRESWRRGRKTALPLATQMGAHAASLAGNGGTIDRAMAKTAADAVRRDPACPGGGGKFC
jgi:hypothetical protein